MRHLSSWILLLLSTFTSCTQNGVTMGTCTGETASFQWEYKVPPFYAIEWYFGKAQIAEKLSQDSLSINDNYKSRFVLLEKDTVGFNLTNVKEGDKGHYKCILILQSTSIPVEKKWTLNVKACKRRKRASDASEQECTCSDEKEPPATGDEKEPPATDSPGTANPVAVAVPVVIAVIAAIAVVAFVVIRKKRKSTGENQNVRTEGKPRSDFESHELVEQEDKIKSAAENGEESQDLV